VNIAALSMFSALFCAVIAFTNRISSQWQIKYSQIMNDISNPADRIRRILETLVGDITSPDLAALTVAVVVGLGVGLALCYAAASGMISDATKPIPSFVILSRRARAAKKQICGSTNEIGEIVYGHLEQRLSLGF
jgi:hypothetical protein